MLPFSVKFDANGNVRRAEVSKFDFLWFVTTIGIYLLLAFIYFQTMEIPNDPSASYILFFGDSIFNIVGLVFAAVIIVLDMCNRFKIVKMLKGFSTFGKAASSSHTSICLSNLIQIFQFPLWMQVKRYGIDMNYNDQKRIIFIWYMVNIIAVFLLTLSLYLNANDSSNAPKIQILIYFCVHMIQFLFTGTVVSTYCTAIFRLHDRFDIINNLFK